MTQKNGIDPDVVEAIESDLRTMQDARGKQQLVSPIAAERDLKLATDLEADLAGHSNVQPLNAGAKHAPTDEYDGDQLKEDLLRFGLPCGMFADEYLNRPIKD